MNQLKIKSYDGSHFLCIDEDGIRYVASTTTPQLTPFGITELAIVKADDDSADAEIVRIDNLGRVQNVSDS